MQRSRRQASMLLHKLVTSQVKKVRIARMITSKEKLNSSVQISFLNAVAPGRPEMQWTNSKKM